MKRPSRCASRLPRCLLLTLHSLFASASPAEDDEATPTLVKLDQPRPRVISFVGHNTNIAGKPRFSYDDPRATPLVCKLAPNILRYPGGTVAMTFAWEWERTLRFQHNHPYLLADFLSLI